MILVVFWSKNWCIVKDWTTGILFNMSSYICHLLTFKYLTCPTLILFLEKIFARNILHIWHAYIFQTVQDKCHIRQQSKANTLLDLMNRTYFFINTPKITQPVKSVVDIKKIIFKIFCSFHTLFLHTVSFIKFTRFSDWVSIIRGKCT